MELHRFIEIRVIALKRVLTLAEITAVPVFEDVDSRVQICSVIKHEFEFVWGADIPFQEFPQNVTTGEAERKTSRCIKLNLPIQNGSFFSVPVSFSDGGSFIFSKNLDVDDVMIGGYVGLNIHIEVIRDQFALLSFRSNPATFHAVHGLKDHID